MPAHLFIITTTNNKTTIKHRALKGLFGGGSKKQDKRYHTTTTINNNLNRAEQRHLVPTSSSLSYTAAAASSSRHHAPQGKSNKSLLARELARLHLLPPPLAHPQQPPRTCVTDDRVRSQSRVQRRLHHAEGVIGPLLATNNTTTWHYDSRSNTDRHGSSSLPPPPPLLPPAFSPQGHTSTQEPGAKEVAQVSDIGTGTYPHQDNDDDEYDDDESYSRWNLSQEGLGGGGVFVAAGSARLIEVPPSPPVIEVRNIDGVVVIARGAEVVDVPPPARVI